MRKDGPQKYSVGRVRNYLENSDEGVDILASTYKIMSRRFSHFSTSTIAPNPAMALPEGWTDRERQEHRDVSQALLMELLVAVFIFLHEVLRLIDHPKDDPVTQKVIADLDDAFLELPFVRQD